MAGFKASAAYIMVLANFSFKMKEFSGYYYHRENHQKYTKRKKKSSVLFEIQGVL